MGLFAVLTCEQALQGVRGGGGGVEKRENPAARALGKACSQANAVLVQIFISL